MYKIIDDLLISMVGLSIEMKFPMQRLIFRYNLDNSIEKKDY